MITKEVFDWIGAILLSGFAALVWVMVIVAIRKVIKDWDYL